MSGRHVVVGVDGSLISTHAQDVAAEEAVRRSVPLEIVYAVPDLDVAGPVLAVAGARCRARNPGLVVRLTAVVGEPASALVRRGADASVTVVGTRAAGALVSLASRSVAHQVAEGSRRPVLVVRAGRGTRPADPGEVLVAVESDADIEVAGAALDEAARRGAHLRFLPVAGYRARVAAGPWLSMSGKRQAVTAAAAVGDHPGRIGHFAEEGAPFPVSDRDMVSATADADVVVIAFRRHRGLVRRHAHSVHALLHHSHCPVLLVPTAGRATHRTPRGGRVEQRPDRK